MGSGRVYWLGTGIALPGTLLPIPRVHPSPYPSTASAVPGTALEQVNMAVGLRSVAQLTLDGHISETRGITEVYNLVRIQEISNHFLIPGNK